MIQGSLQFEKIVHVVFEAKLPILFTGAEVALYKIRVFFPMVLRERVGADSAHSRFYLNEMLEGNLPQIPIKAEEGVKVIEARAAIVTIVTGLLGRLGIYEGRLIPIHDGIVALSEKNTRRLGVYGQSSRLETFNLFIDCQERSVLHFSSKQQKERPPTAAAPMWARSP